MLVKTSLDYSDMTSDFKPLPKYGHLSKKTPEYEDAELAISERFGKVYNNPTWAACREAGGDADAAMPPGGPDRYRDIVTDLIEFPARDGHMIELKIYKSPNVVQDATLMYRTHGGGFIFGRHEVDGAENVYAATNPNIVVVSVDYRKAPEYRFPYAINDSYDGLLWCKANAKTLGVNPEKIIVSGLSAGANLAAALALEARETGVTGIVAQVLNYPLVCHSKYFPRNKYEYGSNIQNADSPVLSAFLMETFHDEYTPEAQPDYRHSPLLAVSHEGLPPTLIQCGGYDILRDDAFAYAEALENAGVEVELHAYAGLPHDFANILVSIPQTKEFYDRYMRFLEKHTG